MMLISWQLVCFCLLPQTKTRGAVATVIMPVQRTVFYDRVFSDDSVQNRDRSIDASVCRKGRTCRIVHAQLCYFQSDAAVHSLQLCKCIVVAPAECTELHRYVVLP